MILNSEGEYRNFEGVNQSRLKLIENPSLFRNIKREDDDDGEPEHFKFGTYIDDLLVDADTSRKYLVSDLSKFPPEDTKKVIDSFVKANDCSLSIDAYKEPLLKEFERAGVYTTFKPETTWGKITKYTAYFDLAKERDKIILTSDQSALGVYYKNILLTDPLYSKYYTSSSEIENRKKVRLAYDYMYQSPEISGIIPIKGELDTLHINHKNKTYCIVDDKTTSDLYGFPGSVFKYRYDFQLSFYDLLVRLCASELEIKGYTYDSSYLIAISSTFPQPPLIYKSNNNKAFWGYTRSGRNYIGVDEALRTYLMHRESDNWTVPIKMVKQGHLSLNFGS